MKAQRATTYEIGTRGSSGGIGCDISLYRSEIRNELQCLTLFPWAPCTTTNADRTVHQGIEVGLDATIPLSALGDSLALTAAYTYSDFFFEGSEEHTSELQSLMRISYAVFCLKKKKTHTRNEWINEL